jgi:hypothetical protein
LHLTLHANQIKPLLARVHARSREEEKRTRELPSESEVEDELGREALSRKAETSSRQLAERTSRNASKCLATSEKARSKKENGSQADAAREESQGLTPLSGCQLAMVLENELTAGRHS